MTRCYLSKISQMILELHTDVNGNITLLNTP